MDYSSIFFFRYSRDIQPKNRFIVIFFSFLEIREQSDSAYVRVIGIHGGFVR